jgi:hypothetical protein
MELPGQQGHHLATETTRPPQVCPECDCELVQPVDWQEADGSGWTVSLRCPNCEWLGSGTFAQELIDSFDEILDDGVQVLLCALKELTRDNLSDEIDRFVAALEADAILPEDF